MDSQLIISEEGFWKITGIYFDEKNKSRIADGEIKVIKNNEGTILNSSIELQKGEEVIERYINFTANSKISNELVLKINQSGIGNLAGQAMISEDNLVIIFESSNKEFAGSEYIKKISDYYYKNRGIIYRGNVIHSSWSYELRREKNDKRNEGNM